MSTEWTAEAARRLARHHLGVLGDRWRHAQAVGTKADRLEALGLIDEAVMMAAWLHDVGYSDQLQVSGFHPLDGARYLDSIGAPAEVVSLVAFHSGAEFEAQERGLAAALDQIGQPQVEDLDALTLLDMTTGPDGQPVHESARLDEILSRYTSEDPVHVAVTRSRAGLLEACARARVRLGLPDEGVFAAL